MVSHVRQTILTIYIYYILYVTTLFGSICVCKKCVFMKSTSTPVCNIYIDICVSMNVYIYISMYVDWIFVETQNTFHMPWPHAMIEWPGGPVFFSARCTVAIPVGVFFPHLKLYPIPSTFH